MHCTRALANRDARPALVNRALRRAPGSIGLSNLLFLIRYAWRKAFIMAGATVHAAIVLTRILTAVLATILPGAKTVLGTSIILGDRGSYD
jgi:hypothetical protein